MYGESGYDNLNGGDDLDTLYGGTEDDNLCGEDGAGDELDGPGGDDTLLDSDASDILRGSGGTDHCATNITSYASSPFRDFVYTSMSHPCRRI